jgi:hypothetical protein
MMARCAAATIDDDSVRNFSDIITTLLGCTAIAVLPLLQANKP